MGRVIIFDSYIEKSARQNPRRGPSSCWGSMRIRVLKGAVYKLEGGRKRPLYRIEIDSINRKGTVQGKHEGEGSGGASISYLGGEQRKKNHEEGEKKRADPKKVSGHAAWAGFGETKKSRKRRNLGPEVRRTGEEKEIMKAKKTL